VTEHLKMTEESLAAFGILYKYRDAKCPRNWEILEKQELWFPTPDTFNDPFDANIGMRYDLLPDDIINQIIEGHIARTHPGAGYFLRQALIKQLTERMKDPVAHDDAMRQWMNRLISKMRVFCICPEPDNILLWSHYGNNHTGFAIGFDAMKLHALWKSSGGFLMGHVAYAPEYPILLPPVSLNKNIINSDIITSILNIKSDIWAYEKEIRMTMFDGPQKVSFTSTLISEVVLGCKMEPKHQEKMLNLMDGKYPHANVYRAKLHREAFALEFDTLRG
jgi:Protein of unknown function (DUF2971)